MLSFKKLSIRKKNFILAVALLLFFCFLLTALIPPLQSPDERDHLKRAYFLSQGQVFLTAQPHKLSGGPLDSGLLEYLNFSEKYPFRPDIKVTEQDIVHLKTIPWSHKSVYAEAPGTGYYFPVLYAPQAIGLTVGRWLGLSVDRSYMLSRLSAIAAIGILLFASFLLTTPNPLVLALLILPMSLFQEAACSLDGVSTAMTILAISCFLRITQDRDKTPLSLLILLAVSVALVTSCRQHALPLLGLIFLSAAFTRRKASLIAGTVASLFTVSWTILSLKTTVFKLPLPATSASERAVHYVLHPWSFFKILLHTLGLHTVQVDYLTTFLGRLGWLDTPLPGHAYGILTAALIVLAVLSCLFTAFRNNWQARLSLGCAALVSFLLIFFAMLITWSDDAPTTIGGVQGRYFLIPALLFAYALNGNEKQEASTLCYCASLTILGGLFLFSSHEMIGVLLQRYYITP
ncbi:DUF2142 domain-containing protein [Acetobacter cerevisiae]|uniref:DUF2142 domain-containing protein n=1 Tax=Acetobacter cerevisiae TaxID=178900 RepID=A0A149UXT4_9PROT|nr:DUF2142 domain-containing protein [Acetobacter cerevisiae]KXV72563.1 hypothetical protein AD952_03990 [Acetobacter cerevisiae]MCP1244906.1 DUF2142 domain-containing protein [Acetobacter cerevisiae]MCP1254483.1 DUF2142 domain-containing protein [Acetobacter cerevisiae]